MCDIKIFWKVSDYNFLIYFKLPFKMSDSNIPASTASTTASSNTAIGKKAPADFLRTVIGRPVTVRLTTGADYRGK